MNVGTQSAREWCGAYLYAATGRRVRPVPYAAAH